MTVGRTWTPVPCASGTSLRHTLGTLAVRRAELTAVQSWMGHADIQTTIRYVHHRDRGGEARMLEEAFALTEASAAQRPTPR